MMISTTVLTNLLLASAAFAAPSLGTRLKHRGAVSQTQYRKYWAGAAYNSSKDTFTAVSGVFTVPDVTGCGSVYAFVGIDGHSSEVTTVQIGVEADIIEGKAVYSAWYYWFPKVYATVPLTDIDFEPGHGVNLTIATTGPNYVSASVENLHTGQKFTANITSEEPLLRQDAEWIVGGFKEHGEEHDSDSYIEFAKFNTIFFHDAFASTPNGDIGPGLATILDIRYNDKVLTSSSVNASGITINQL